MTLREFTNNEALLARTPAVLNALLTDLPDNWIDATEGEGTWSPWGVVAHLNHCERTDWMPRLEIILKDGPSRTFDAFDMEAHFAESAGKTMSTLLEEFTSLRQANLSRLNSLALTPAQLQLEGTHPVLGRVTLANLISTWTVHDLTHINQICRTLARQNQQAVGPWAKYLSILP